MKNICSTIINSCLLATGLAALGIFSSVSTQSASAANLVVSKIFSGNDCAGYFGKSFEACNVFINSNGTKIELSPVIAKFETVGKQQTLVGAKLETNKSLYPSVDGTEWTFTNVHSDQSKTGTWTYTPGTNDPGIKYWATKAGNNFKLFWEVEKSAVASGGACSGADKYTLACLQAALLVKSGIWDTPGGKGLSHITFYNTKVPHVVESVPEPTTAAALGLFALSSLGLLNKKKS